MPGLSISLLGSFSAALDEKIVSGFPTRLAQALLIYLVCQPERHRREPLMAFFWPELSPPTAQHNLRQSLYLLRRTMPTIIARDGRAHVPLILTDRDTVQLNPDAAVEVDIHRFATLLKWTWNEREELTEAVGLYRGDFLADFYLSDSNPFEEWAATYRAAYRSQALMALKRLTSIYLADEAFVTAETYARQQLTIDPLHEAGHRQLIELLARSGRRSAALVQFDIYRGLLRNELGVKPGSETLALVEAIQAGELLPARQYRDHIHGYQVQEELGRGSFGVVFRAFQAAIGRDVALKVIPAHYADDVGFIRRFEAEAQLIARLEHPQIVPLHDYWREPGNAYLVMRYLRGGNLKAAIAKGAWSLEQTIQLVEQLAAALYAAHRHGIVHRDVKPANILLDEESNAYLSDFSLAKLFQPEETRPTFEIITGTPAYLSPEQARNEPASPLSDQYSLGLVVYEVLRGQPPFTAGSLPNLLQMHIHEPLPSLVEHRPEIPTEVEAVLRRATAKQPEERFADVLAFAKAFRVASRNQSETVPFIQSEPLLPVTNPYKGLLAFTEADAALFYGRTTRIQQLLKRMNETKETGRFLAVVGPSGSGKSSLVMAGLVPALRQGAVPGSENWFIVDIIPGTRPFEEIETALLRIAVNPAPSLLEQIQTDEHGLLRTVKEILPANDSSELLIIIDQFEELFTLVPDPHVTAHFLASLHAAVTATHSPLRVIVTLRADFYDRPLLYPGFSDLIQQHTEIVVPLTADELVQAIERPAARVGVTVEPELVAALVAGVNDQPGALPLLQYTLSELFEQREDSCLTLHAYRQFGTISSALSRRADAVYAQLDEAGQTATRALFSRLVTLGEGVEDTRRRVFLAELMALDLAGEQGGRGTEEQSEISQSPNLLIFPRSTPHAPLPTILDLYGRFRLLSFDRDPLTRGPTVEIAHEALLRAWPRLRAWLDENRAELRLGRLLTQAATEWQAAGHDEGFLLRGARLNQLAPLATGTIALTDSERHFLETSLEARQARQAAEEARRRSEIEQARKLAETERQRAEEQAHHAQRLRRRAALLAGALILALILATAAVLFSRQAGESALLAQTNAGVAQTAEAQALDQRATAAAEADIRATAEIDARQQQAEAEEQARLATSRELALAAQNQLTIDPELSLLLALQALEIQDTKEAKEALHQALQTSRTLQTFDQPEPTVDTVLAGPKGPLPATLTREVITIFDPVSGDALYTLPDASFSPFIPFYAALNQKGDEMMLLQWQGPQITYKAWALDNEQLIVSHMLPIQLDPRSPLAIDSDGQILAVGYQNGTTKLWDTNTGQLLVTLGEQNDAHDDWIIGVTFDQDSDRLGAISYNGQVSIWNVPASIAAGSGQQLISLVTTTLIDNGSLTQFAFIDETTVAVGSGGGWLEIWDLTNTPGAVFSQLAHNINFTDFTVSKDRSKLATSSPGAVKIWSVPRGELLLTLPTGINRVEEVYFNLDGSQVMTVDAAGTVRVWDARLHPLGETLSFDPSPTTKVAKDLQISPNGQQLAISSDFKPASLWAAATGEHVKTLLDGEGATYGAVYSPDGSRLATVGQDDRIRIWDLASGEVLMSFSGNSSGLVYDWWRGIIDIAYSPDGSRLATAGGNGDAKVWDAETGEELLAFTRHTSGLASIMYSPDGRLIATSSDQPDGTARVWDAQTGEQYLVLEGGGGMMWKLAFSPDSSLLITGSDGGGARVWDVVSGNELYATSQEPEFIPDVAFTPDGDFFVTAGASLRLWRVEDGEEVLTLSNDLFWWFTISPDGRYIYATDYREVLRVFTLQLEDTIALAHARLTRWWRPEECQRYLHTTECPPSPQKFNPDR